MPGSRQRSRARVIDPMKILACIFTLCPVLTGIAFADPASSADIQEKQFLYKLKLVPRLLASAAWSDEDNAVVAEHFDRLKALHEEGVLILAGRTLNEDNSQFGIVIFKAATGDIAKQLMNSDPAVVKGIMTATLFPYRVALIRAP